MTKISVVMTVYNSAATLGATIESILQQSERDFELVVVDDGSGDATPEILARYAAADPRIRVLRNAENAGITRSLIAGCRAAEGEYIARHDAGDLSLPTRLQRQSALLDAASDLAFVACWTEFTGPHLEHLFENHGTGRAVEPMRVLDPAAPNPMLDGPPHHGSVMFRRAAYENAGGYRAQFYYGQDWDLWYRLAEQGRFQMAPEVLYRARIQPESISVEARDAQQELAKLSRAALLARVRGASDAELVAAAARIGKAPPLGRAARARGLYFIGEALRRNGDRRARGYLGDAIRTDPLQWRAWLRYAQTWTMR
jgi:glycosyltransferase involved in cell wall biosynthesis